jgi:signal transduction histidine kinase
MRTTLLIALLALSLGLTATSLMVIRTTVQRQINDSLASDLNHSVRTFENLQRQRRETLSRSSALVADLPSLKALMTTSDQRTIEDGGVEFWKVSGSDLFVLGTTAGKIVTYNNLGAPLASADVQNAFAASIEHAGMAQTAQIGGRLFEMIAQPLYFGPVARGSVLGYVGIASVIDQRMAREVSQASAADVAFVAQSAIVVSTLPPSLEAQLGQAIAGGRGGSLQSSAEMDIYLAKSRYLAALVPLTSDVGSKPLELVVLKSYDRASDFLRRVNRWIFGLGIFSLVLGSVIAVTVARGVTRPLEGLVDGARALGRGNFEYQLGDGGTAEIVELRGAFDRMRLELKESQAHLVETERLATIGRMASSISHDLRHYLSAMYANAEFLSLEKTPQEEREELIAEVQTAVNGMTDLLDSLLIFSRTGRALNLSVESIGAIVGGAVGMLRAHPEARDVMLIVDAPADVEMQVDGKKLGRAIFNLLLNACQAARRGRVPPEVEIAVEQEEAVLRLRIEDTGPGIPETIRETLFEPFVSSGKQNGVGLGLTLALHIVQEHGGTVKLTESAAGNTMFVIELPFLPHGRTTYAASTDVTATL